MNGINIAENEVTEKNDSIYWVGRGLGFIYYKLLRPIYLVFVPLMISIIRVFFRIAVRHPILVLTFMLVLATARNNVEKQHLRQSAKAVTQLNLEKK